MPRLICVDTSFVVKLLVTETGRQAARAAFASWLSNGTTVLAPDLLAYEVASVLAKKVRRGHLQPGEALGAYHRFWRLPIELITLRTIGGDALRSAVQAGLYNAYDMHFLETARWFSAPLWTADERLAQRFPDFDVPIHVLSDGSVAEGERPPMPRDR